MQDINLVLGGELIFPYPSIDHYAKQIASKKLKSDVEARIDTWMDRIIEYLSTTNQDLENFQEYKANAYAGIKQALQSKGVAAFDTSEVKGNGLFIIPSILGNDLDNIINNSMDIIDTAAKAADTYLEEQGVDLELKYIRTKPVITDQYGKKSARIYTFNPARETSSGS